MITWSVEVAPDPAAVLEVRSAVTRAELGLDQVLVEVQERARAASQPAGALDHGLLADGLLVGRLLLDQGQGADWSLVDVAVHPAWQRRGLASWSLNWLIRQADCADATISLHCAARHVALYRRAGFFVVGEGDGVRQRMLWSAEPVAALVRLAVDDDSFRQWLVLHTYRIAEGAAALGLSLTQDDVDRGVRDAREAFARRWVL